MSAPVLADKNARSPLPPGPYGVLARGLRQIFRWIRPEQLYVVLVALLVMSSARVFYDSLRMQTEQVELWFSPELFPEFASKVRRSPWSAPLDDVFIHFDFARSTARGFPFQWVEGNGYSSGGTSLLYPFVIGLGYWLGYRGLSLMLWAAVVAVVCVVLALLGARSLFSRLPAAWALVLPPIFLSVGGLNWTLFSGMEVALFLAVWAGCLVFWRKVLDEPEPAAQTRASLALGGLSALLVACRPEASPLVALFGLSASLPLLREKKWGAAFLRLVQIGLVAGLIVSSHLLANRLLTGDATAAGGLAKLELHHPYMSRSEVISSWFFFLRYQFERLTIHHFGAIPGLGAVLWILGLLPLFFEKTRREASLLWLSILLWSGLVALNGQVRWQNERYAMPTVAFLLTLVALGVAASLDRAFTVARRGRGHQLALWAVPLGLALFVAGQAERFKEQVWFFGRAGRNILEQHVRTGDYLGRFESPRPHRVMVSDAGAIPYIADLPAFDLIGLGGYHDLPVAKASREGVGAAVELIEHMPRRERPDLLALYPSWWGNFVVWFGRPVRDFAVRGNVICGGLEMALYQPDWSSLELSGHPFAAQLGERRLDEVDVADLISEKQHRAGVDLKGRGYVDMKMLPDPRDSRRDLWDAGRLITPDVKYQFQVRGSSLPRALLVRIAPYEDVEISLGAPGQAAQTRQVEKADHWQEIRFDLPPHSGPEKLQLGVVRGEVVLHHLFELEQYQAPHAAEHPALPVRPAP